MSCAVNVEGDEGGGKGGEVMVKKSKHDVEELGRHLDGKGCTI